MENSNFDRDFAAAVDVNRQPGEFTIMSFGDGSYAVYMPDESLAFEGDGLLSPSDVRTMLRASGLI